MGCWYPARYTEWAPKEESGGVGQGENKKAQWVGVASPVGIIV